MACKRIVYIDAFHVQPTPFGVPTASTPLHDSVQQAIQRLYPDCNTVVVGLLAPSPIMCIASLHSAPIDDRDANCSVLLLSWFVANANAPISDQIAMGLSQVRWEEDAVNSYV